MRKAADVLFLLATFSIRTNLLDKAEIYGRAGHHLFPDDLRLIEVYAYALLLKGDVTGAETVLQATPTATRNLAFLRARVAMLAGRPIEEQRAGLRAYLDA